MIFNCHGCKLNFEAVDFNVARIHIECPICATHNHIGQSLSRVYPSVGERIIEIMSKLKRTLSKARTSEDYTFVVHRAQYRVEKLVEEVA